MGAITRSLVVVGTILFGALYPSVASALTVEDILGMARAGVTDAVILALIDRDKAVFTIEPEQIVNLQRAGLSEAVILALLKSGRDEGEQAARADAASNSDWIMASMPTEPLVVVVGHGPDRPNVAHPDGFYSGPPSFFSAFNGAYGFTGGHGSSFNASRRNYGQRAGAPRFDMPRQMCVAQVNTARSTKPLSYLTECPEVMQPRRLR